MAGSNIVPDEQQIMNFLNSIFDTLEDIYLKNDENKKKMELMKALKTHLNLGGKAAYSLIPQKFTKEIEQMLYDKSIPYFAAPDEKGNSMFIVRDKDYQKFLDIQKSVECLSTEYAKELTPTNILELYKTHGLSKIDTVTIPDKDMALIAEQKLYQSGVTFAKINDKNGDTCFLISPMSKFSPDGNDLCNFELTHAFEQSKADPLISNEKLIETRIQQARFDQMMLTNFANKIKRGESCILHSAKNHSPVYIEVSSLGISVCSEVMKDGKMIKDIKKLDINKDDSIDNIIAVVSKQTEKIKDMIISNQVAFEQHEDFLSKNEKENSTIYTSYSRPIAPKSPARNIAKTEIEPMISAINTEATKQVNALIGDRVLPQSELYEMKKSVIEGIMVAKELPEIQRFLSDSHGMDSTQKAEWFNNVAQHFTCQNEMGNQYEAKFDKMSKHTIKSLINPVKDIEPIFTQQQEQD